MDVKNPRRLTGADAAIEGVFSTVVELCACHGGSVKGKLNWKILGK